MAKSSIRKSDPVDTPAPKRRRTTAADSNGTKPAAKAAPRRRKPEVATSAVSTADVDGFEAESEASDITHEQIAVRAYHIYLERGYSGDQFQDWLAAERQLRDRSSRPRG
jgi:hypothetical protein